MSVQCEKFLKKNKINFSDILYIIRENKKTSLHFSDGTSIVTYIPAKTIVQYAQRTEFLNINKGTYVSKNYIAEIKNGFYAMTDGAVFKGRSRTPGEHSANERDLHRHQNRLAYLTSDNIRERFSCVDNMPVAFCVIELVFDTNGHGIDFIFRYCNKEMEVIEGLSVEEMINKSFYEIFKNADKKWLITYADVALNGGRKELHTYSPEIGKNLCIQCFQPQEGFCGCVLTEE